MKHYNIVKQTAHHLIFASVLLLVANVAIWATGFAFVSPSAVKAECNQGQQPASFSVVSTNSQEAVITVHRSSMDTHFSYVVKIYGSDTAGCTSQSCIQNINRQLLYQSSPIDIAAGTWNPSPLTTSQLTNLKFGTGQSVVAVASVSFTSYGDSGTCQHTPMETTVNFSNTNSTVGNASISLSPPNPTFTVDADNKITGAPTINMSFSGTAGQGYALYITDCSGNPHFKDSGQIPNGYSWTPEELTCNSHTATLKADDGTTLATATVNIGTGGSTGTTAPDSEDDLTPSKITIQELFGGEVNFPKRFETLGQVFEVIVTFLFWILGILAFISLVMGGIQFVTSGGDSAKEAKAKKTLLYSVLGIILAIFSVSIFNIAARFWSGP